MPTTTVRTTDDGQPVTLEPAGWTPYMLARELRTRIEALDRQTDSRYCLEYVSSSYLGEHDPGSLPPYQSEQPIRDRYRWVAVWPVTGGSEGHYLHVELIYQRDAAGRELRSNLHVPIALIKIFGGWDAAAELAGIVGRWLGA